MSNILLCEHIEVCCEHFKAIIALKILYFLREFGHLFTGWVNSKKKRLTSYYHYCLHRKFIVFTVLYHYKSYLVVNFSLLYTGAYFLFRIFSGTRMLKTQTYLANPSVLFLKKSCHEEDSKKAECPIQTVSRNSTSRICRTVVVLENEFE